MLFNLPSHSDMYLMRIALFGHSTCTSMFENHPFARNFIGTLSSFSFPDLTIRHLLLHRPPHVAHLGRPHLRLLFDQDRHLPPGLFTPFHLLQTHVASSSSHPESTKTFERLTNDTAPPLNGDERRKSTSNATRPGGEG